MLDCGGKPSPIPTIAKQQFSAIRLELFLRAAVFSYNARHEKSKSSGQLDPARSGFEMQIHQRRRDKHMQSGSKSSVVPNDIAADVEEIVNVIRSAAEQHGQQADDAVRIVRPLGKEMVPGAIETVILIFGTGTTWFTKKWFDTFVWPEIEKRVRRPSQKAVDFFFGKIPFPGTGNSEKIT
jgi:hypothetical protein